jgi:hypothetical protein
MLAIRFYWLPLMLAAVAPAATLEVSPQGPIASLTAARDAIRALRAKGDNSPATVLLRGGVYRLPETFVLTPQDSDVTYAAYPGERPIISGGRVITGWKKGAGSIWSAPAAGQFRQLFVNGRRALRARTPTNGFYRIDGPSSQDKPFALKFRGADIKPEWAKYGVEVVALLAWAEIRSPIAQVDAAAHTARLKPIRGRRIAKPMRATSSRTLRTASFPPANGASIRPRAWSLIGRLRART